MRSPELRVKLKTLAAESLIIKREILRYRDDLIRQKLHLHRVHDVREEARATNIAYGFLNGLAYGEIEASCYEQPKWNRVAAMVKKYGTEGTVEERIAALEEWKKVSINNRGMFIPSSSVSETEEA